MCTSIFTASLIRSLTADTEGQNTSSRPGVPGWGGGGGSLLGGAPLEVRDAQAAAVHRVGQMGEVAAKRLQLGQRVLLQPGEPQRRQALHHLEEAA